MFEKKVVEVSNLPENIEWDAVYKIQQSNPNSYTHGMFKYPCKFIPEIPRWVLSVFASKKTKVLDPFAGSGTTLLESNIKGYNAFGTEIDEIAKLIIKCKTTKLSQSQIETLDEHLKNIINRIDNHSVIRYVPEINNLTHWFNESAVEQLGIIKSYIDDIIDIDVQNFFKICFVSIIKKVSNADNMSPKPYVSSKIIKNPPIVRDEFCSIYNNYKEMVISLHSISNFGSSKLLEGNALAFKTTKKFDIAITSPPYINAFDYGRTMRLENLWLNTLSESELRNKKKDYVGTEKINMKNEFNNLNILTKSHLLSNVYDKVATVDVKRSLIIKRFFDDMYTNLNVVYNRLIKNGIYAIVIGNSVIRQCNVESWKILKDLSETIGYNYVGHFSYAIQNPYIRIPRNNKGGEIKEDHILILRKE